MPKITFGIQPRHIKIIEAQLKRLNETAPGINWIYQEYFWELIGEEIGWIPFTIALYYFRYLEEKGGRDA